MKTVEFRMLECLEKLVDLLRNNDNIGPQQMVFLSKILTITDFLINFHNYTSNHTLMTCLHNLENTVNDLVKTLQESPEVNPEVELLFYRANCEARILDIFRGTFDNNIFMPLLNTTNS